MFRAHSVAKCEICQLTSSAAICLQPDICSLVLVDGNWLGVMSRVHLSTWLWIALVGSAVLIVTIVSLTVATKAAVRHVCPRRQHIVYLRDTDCSKNKQLSSTPETVALLMDNFVSKEYRIDQQR